MVRIVLSEMERDGTFTPALAVTTGDETEALTCTIQGVVRNLTAYANRIGSVGKLSNRIDISQAMGGVPQAVNFDFELIDWDGFNRVSVAMLEGTARFVGWEVSVIVDNADPVSLAVQSASANGDTISFHCVSRFELTSRPCAFGSGAQQVGLVVGGHDVSVETDGLPEPVGLFRDIPGTLYQGNPTTPTNFYASSNVASRKRNIGTNYDFYFDCKSPSDTTRFRQEISDLIDGGGTVLLVGKEMSWFVPYVLSSPYEPGLMIPVSKAFYDTENPADVGLFSQPISATIAAGSPTLVGFVDNSRISVPEGATSYAGSVLSFRPYSLIPSGFRSFALLPCDIAWSSENLRASDAYYNGTEFIKTDGTDPGDFDVITNLNAPPVNHTKFTIWDSIESFDPTGFRVTKFHAAGRQDWKPDKLIVDMKARITRDSGSIPMSGHLPFLNENLPFDNVDSEITISQNGPGYFDPRLAFDSFDDLNAYAISRYEISRTATGQSVDAAFQLLAVTVYGQTNLSFGANSAVVTPGAGPLDAPEGTYPARQTGGVTLPEAAACIISANGWFPQEEGNYPVGTIPTWNAPASAVGEYIDPAKSFIEAAELLAQESWAIFALEQNAIGTADELPDPPRIQLGQDTDVITEPTIEYQLFGGKYLGKAYISNVDLPFDSTNASAFYGGWGLAPAGAEEAEGTDYGYLIWQRCRAAFLAHGIKRGQTYQFNGIHDAQTMGRMWWEAKRNGYRRIDWLAFHPRYMTFSVKRFNSFGWAGSSTRLPQIMAGGAGYDVAAWGPLYNDSVTVVAVDADPMTGITEFSVALPPVVTDGHDIGLTTDTLNNTLDLSPDTLDSGLPLTTDTLEA